MTSTWLYTRWNRRRLGLTEADKEQDMGDEQKIELIKLVIAEKFAPAIDFKAPYARVMLDHSARAIVDLLKDQP